MGANVPEGADHVPVVAPPVIIPASVIELPAQTVWSILAFVTTA